MGSSTESSLDGLKFGHKIYFEQDSCSTGGGPAAAKPKKVRSSPVHSGQPPRCQVEGCQADLTDSKAYYSRHKVCGTHSKSPTVIVAGLQQRFCQQCSRFHLLSEFDQGKRSCRRRLAGHNERRRKPPPGSILPPRYELSGRVGSFLMDFSSYPRLGRDAWQVGRMPLGGATTFPWHGSDNNSNCDDPPPSDIFSAGRAGIHAMMHPPPLPPGGGECIPVIPDSDCALSLLSNQPWVGPRSQSPPLGFGLHSMVSGHAPPMGEPATVSPPPLPSPTVGHFSAAPHWAIKGDNMGSASGSHQIIPGLGLGHFLQHPGQEFELGRRVYSEPEQSRGLDSSTKHMNWSL